MKVKVLKTGPYALNPWGPVVEFKEGERYEDADEICQKMIDLRWVVSLEGEDSDESEDEEGESTEDNEEVTEVKDASFFEELISDLETEKDKKAKLQDWGVLNLDHKVSKSKTIDNIIADLVEFQSQGN